MTPLATSEDIDGADALPPDDDAARDEHVRDEHIRAREAAIDEALKESFPASDPPAWMP